jgi:colanic acid biosynthesis glycosyl transferase WcaI
VNWLQDVFPEIASHLGVRALPAWLSGGMARLRDQSLHFAHANVVLGTRMHAHLEQRHVASGRIRVIENWCDGDAVRPLPSRSSALRAQLGLSEKFVVGYSGNLGRAHEFETILAAATRLRERDDIAFLMIGGGIKMRELRAATIERGLTNFIFLPYQARELLSDALAAADVHLACLLPALEGLIVPSKVYGIFAAARPIVFIGDVDGEIARIVRGARCGESVAIGASDALATIVKRLAADPDACRELGERGRALFVERYTVDRAVGAWLDMLGEVEAAA